MNFERACASKFHKRISKWLKEMVELVSEEIMKMPAFTFTLVLL